MWFRHSMFRCCRRSRSHLIEVARAGQTETYGDLKAVLGLPHARNGLGRLLDLMSEDCIRRRPVAGRSGGRSQEW